MEENIYRELIKKWDDVNKLKLSGSQKHNTYYRKRTGLRANEKSEFIKFANLFEDKFVIDIGCNAGYVTYNLAKYAKGWVGLERNIHWFTQALETAKYINTPGEFLNISIGQFCKEYESKYPYNALYGSCILYYLSEEELSLLQNLIFPKCDIVLLISREDKPDKTLWNNRFLSKYENIKKFLEESNLEVEIRNRDSNWVAVIGRNK